MTDYYNQNKDTYSESMDQRYQTYEVAEKPSEPKPMVTYALLGINILLYFLMELAGGSTKDEVLIRFGAKVNPLIWSGEYWRLITPIFLHIGVTHLMLNCWSLYVFGPLVEKVFGRIKFLVIYLVAGLTGSIMSVLMTPNLAAGASGAIFGLMGALLYLSYHYRSVINKHFVINLLLVIGFNIYYGFSNTGIDNYAHLGGLFGGLVTSTILGTIHESYLTKLRITFSVIWITIIVFLVTLSLQPNESNPDWNFSFGNQALYSNNYESAVTYYQKVLKTYPKSAETHFRLGLTYKYLNMRKEAIKEFQTVLELDPSRFAANQYIYELNEGK